MHNTKLEVEKWQKLLILLYYSVVLFHKIGSLNLECSLENVAFSSLNKQFFHS